MRFNFLYAVGLFFASFALDAIFAMYTLSIIKSKAFAAASMSLLTYLLMALGILSYVNNKWYIIPLALGAFAGTYAIVKREATKNAKQS